MHHCEACFSFKQCAANTSPAQTPKSTGGAPASVLYGALSPKAFGQAFKLKGYEDPPAAKRAVFKAGYAERV